MKIKTSIKYTTIADWLIAVGILNYAGPFTSYNGSLVFIGMIAAVLILFLNSSFFYAKKSIVLWELCFVYFTINSIFNLPRSLKYILIVLVGYLTIQRRIDKRDCANVFKICKVAASIEAISIIIQRSLPDVFYPIAQKWFFYSDQYEFVRHAGTYNKQFSGLCHEVSFAAIVCSIGIIIFFVGILFEKKKKSRFFYMICIGISYYAIILTGKRSIVLTIPVVLVAMYLIYARKRMTKKTLFMTLLLLLTILFAMPNIYSWVSNILSRGSGNIIELTQREEFWALAFEMFKENPMIGLGLNSFDIRFNLSGIRSSYYDFAGAHNSYIQFLGETGIIGLIIFLGAVISTLIKGIRFTDFDRDNVMHIFTSLGILFVLLIYALSGNSFYQPQQLLCVFWCIAVIENIATQSVRGGENDN